MSQAKVLTCTNCGCIDFYNESGFFYCNECQIQSQDIQEHEFGETTDPHFNRASKKIPPPAAKTTKTDQQLTSWETYNYILLGLCEELIYLGAQSSLKPVVRILWLRYLEKLQVFSRERDILPRLQAVNSAKDAEIIYGKPAKATRKRRRSGTSSESDSTTDLSNLSMSQIKAERRKKKRAFVQTHYENVQSQESVPDTSFHSETLETLKSSSESSAKYKKDVTPIKYNSYATKALAKEQSKHHLTKHRYDLDNKLKCHRYSYNYFNKVDPAYNVSVHVLSPNKLYIILYLGLLITDDKIQLSDLLRFIDEGNLSLKDIKHFFPEEYLEKEVNLSKIYKFEPFSSEKFRINSAKMARFLKIEPYLTKTSQSLTDLCQRYCRELCLPTAIFDCCRNLINRTNMKMNRLPQRCITPNYEGRVLALIVFVLKLLYGLDDKTEFEFAKYSDLLNQCQSVEPKMFSIVEWMKFIEYRNLVLSEFHFPTNFANHKKIKDTKMFLDFLRSRKQSEVPLSKSKDDFNLLLGKLRTYQPNSLKFESTLTPFRDYLDVVRRQGLPSNYLDIIHRNFDGDSLVHILEPLKFLELVRKEHCLEVVHGGANTCWEMEELLSSFIEDKRKRKENRKMVTVKLSSDPKTVTRQVPVENRINAKYFQRDFGQENMPAFMRTRYYLAKLCKKTEYDFDGLESDLKSVSGCYFKHYNPFERYWMTAQIHIHGMWEGESEKFMDKYPSNLRLIFKECLRICQQTELNFIEEFINVELFMAYGTDLGVRFRRSKTDDRKLAEFIEEISRLW